MGPVLVGLVDELPISENVDSSRVGKAMSWRNACLNGFGGLVGAPLRAHACSGVVGWGACAPSIMVSSFAVAAFAQLFQAGSVVTRPCASTSCGLSGW